MPYINHWNSFHFFSIIPIYPQYYTDVLLGAFRFQKQDFAQATGPKMNESIVPLK